MDESERGPVEDTPVHLLPACFDDVLEKGILRLPCLIEVEKSR